MKKAKKHAKQQMPLIQKNLLVLFTITFITSGIILGIWYYNTSKTEGKYIELAETVIIKENDEEQKSIINFEELTKINSDAIGWIKIDNTTIDYPIMKSTDNEYYLKKDIYREYDQCGSIFMDYKNKADFTDTHTIIYGHHIKKGIMFADLVHIYEGKLGEDIKILIYLPNKTLTYEVFSSYEIEPEDYSISTAITQNEVGVFTRELKKRSKCTFNGNYENTDKILTLSTCDSTGEKRVLVHAALTEIN